MTNRELKKLHRLLVEAPSTSIECAAVMGVSVRRAQVGIWQLTHVGRASVVGVVPHHDPGPRRGRRKTLNLYGASA